MTNDEKIDGLDAIIEDLIEWELKSYDYEGLKEYFFNTQRDYYLNYRPALEDMLEYRKQYEDTEVVLYWDTDERVVQPITTRKPSWVDQTNEK